MAKTEKAKAAPKNQRLKVFSDPEVRDFLFFDWLDMSYFEGSVHLPDFLKDLGMYGYVTAFRKADNEICFVYNKQITTMRFFDTNKDYSEENVCLIPSYGLLYNKDFAIVDGNAWHFYEMDYDNYRVFPRFINYRFRNGGFCCREVSFEASSLKTTFVVDKLSGARVMLNAEVPNDVESIKQIEDSAERILDILVVGNQRDVYTKYEQLKKYLNNITKYEILHIDGSDNITDEISVVDGKTSRFKISVDKKSTTLFANLDWAFNSPYIVVTKNNEEISFSSRVNQCDLPKIEKPHVIVKEITDFINENMLFAFN